MDSCPVLQRSFDNVRIICRCSEGAGVVPLNTEEDTQKGKQEQEGAEGEDGKAKKVGVIEGEGGKLTNRKPTNNPANKQTCTRINKQTSKPNKHHYQPQFFLFLSSFSFFFISLILS
jgi:hypothetical protein